MTRGRIPSSAYSRGKYWLAWDERADGTRRSPFLTVFWYDQERRRIRSASTGETDLEAGRRALDALYLERTTGRAVCPACRRTYDSAPGLLVADAIATYQTLHADLQESGPAIASRLAHVVDYIAQLPNHHVTVEMVDERWVQRFRSWAEKQPIVSPRGQHRARSLSTVENSVIQLAAAIRFAQFRGDTLEGPRFKSLPIKELNRTPQHRSEVDELAAMFRYCIAPDERRGAKERARRIRERAALHRFLIISVATLSRPDAAYDVSTDPKRGQWNSKARILALNPKGRRQTKKYRATVRLAWQVALHLDNAATGYFVGPRSIRSAWDAMAGDIGLPRDGEAGTKLIRRSMAHLLRSRGVPVAQVEMMLGHRKIESTSELYAPFDPDYLAEAVAGIEAVIDEIEGSAPGAFALPDSNVVTLGRKA